jgi:hypothetical protein
MNFMKKCGDKGVKIDRKHEQRRKEKVFFRNDACPSLNDIMKIRYEQLYSF